MAVCYICLEVSGIYILQVGASTHSQFCTNTPIQHGWITCVEVYRVTYNTQTLLVKLGSQ